jgi:hypothetical protein
MGAARAGVETRRCSRYSPARTRDSRPRRPPPPRFSPRTTGRLLRVGVLHGKPFAPFEADVGAALDFVTIEADGVSVVELAIPS